MPAISSDRIRIHRRRSNTPAIHEGEKRRLLDALCAIHSTVRRRSPDAGALVRCAVQAQGYLALPDAALPSAHRQDGDIPLTAIEWKRLGAALSARRSRLASTLSYLDSWLPPLARTIGLNDMETAVLGLAISYSQDGYITRLWDEMSENRNRSSFLRADAELFALMLGLLEPPVRACLAADGRLRESGLLAADDDGDITVLRRLTSLLARRAPLEGDVRGLLLSPPRRAELPWEAFDHLGMQVELAARLLAAAIAEREPGVGILLYGPPGTGKTAFAATLAARVGAILHPVGESDDDGDEPTGSERLAELRLSQRLLGDASSVLLFDEAEDLFLSFGFGEQRSRSRVFLHRLLEQGRAPVIWTTNDILALGPTVTRRMMLCIEVRQPGIAVRKQLWSDMARSEGVELTDSAASELARAVPAAPGILRNALRATRLVGGDSDTALRVASGVAKVVAGGFLSLPEQDIPADYDPALIQADCNLAALAHKVTCTNTSVVPTLLLSGPPGSGKSAYVRYLAAEMKLPVLMKRASDLLDKYVGGSEAKIASAFAEARDAGAFLVFDEADSLLADRRSAHQSWEVTQVNEMLTWMENHPLPFACTTNLVDRLDPASMRRFLLKVRFGYLTSDQARLAFGRFFSMPAPAALSRLQQLTPADFALVRRRTAFLDAPVSPEEIIRCLEEETAGRDGNRRIGFAV